MQIIENRERIQMRRLNILIALGVLASFHASALATSTDEVCAGLSGLVDAKVAGRFASPARSLTKTEMAALEGAKLELLRIDDYSQGGQIVDVDNDGVDDLFVWNTQGSGRFTYAEVYDINRASSQPSDKLRLKADLGNIGSLSDPRFVRYAGVNYLVVDDGDLESLEVHRLEKTASGAYGLRTACRATVRLEPVTQCRHPACRALAGEIADPRTNVSFVQVQWPHKYFSPAGISVFFGENGEESDFDNTKLPARIWKFGREGYVNQHIYWNLLGLGEEAPIVPAAQRATSEDSKNPQVLQGHPHDRLRRALAQQSQVLTKQLNKNISLPGTGQFFLFDANDRTYWAWDFGEPPYGEAMHITYTRGLKSDYIGTVGIKRTLDLVPCRSECSKPH
jgi:hypothetical protein